MSISLNNNKESKSIEELIEERTELFQAVGAAKVERTKIQASYDRANSYYWSLKKQYERLDRLIQLEKYNQKQSTKPKTKSKKESKESAIAKAIRCLKNANLTNAQHEELLKTLKKD